MQDENTHSINDHQVLCFTYSHAPDLYHFHNTGMENARQRVNQTTVDIMRASKVGGAGGNVPGQYGMPQVSGAM